MEPHDADVLKEMLRSIVQGVTSPAELEKLSDHLVLLRDQLRFKDAGWYAEFTEHVATLDSGSSFVPTDRSEAAQAQAAVDRAMRELHRLVVQKQGAD